MARAESPLSPVPADFYRNLPAGSGRAF
jgi:hypothetical protein